ncbi:MAG: ATP-binding protein [Candidatus Hydrothermales bacterium]
MRILKKNFDSTLSHQLVYVIDEMVSNIEEHGYKGNKGEIKIKILKFKKHVKIEIMDRGEKPPLDSENKIDWEKVIKKGRGLGLYSLKKIVNSLEYSTKGSWNVYKIRKNIK